MKLSVFLVLLPSVSAFITPSVPIEAPCRISGAAMTEMTNNVTPLRMVAETNGDKWESWSMLKIWRDVVSSPSQTKAKVDGTTAEMYAELKKKVQVKMQRKQLEGQMCSLIRIEGDEMSCKAEEHMRRLASELEALQENAAAFGLQRTGLAGSWELIFSSCTADGKSDKKSNRVKSIEEISYVSENLRLSHTDTGVLCVYKRVSGAKKGVGAAAGAAAAAAAAAAGGEDDTANAGGFASTTGVSKAGRASATAAGRPVRKLPLRKRMFFGWRR